MPSALFALLICLVLPSAVRAAEVTIRALDLGFGGIAVSERWIPARVIISPGDEPMQGIVTLDVEQDSTQSARFSAPVALVPGRDTVVTIPIIARRGTTEINAAIIAQGERSSASDRRQFQSLFSREDSDLVAIQSPETTVVLSLGDRGLVPRNAFPPSPTGPGGGESIALTRAPLAELPDAWIALQGASALVVRGADSTRLDDRTLAAVRQWVLSGGRLVVVADEPGEEWKLWLPPAARGWVSLSEPGTEGQTGTPPGISPDAIYAQAQRRVVTISPAGASTGWKPLLEALWRMPSGAPAAAGPVGLGVVCVLGIDPDRALVPGSNSLPALWALALAPLDLQPARPSMNYWVASGSGESDQAAGALAAAMDEVVRVQPVSNSTALLLALILFALALALGPVDRFMLSRLGLRHRSWMTALGWIALASAAMLLIPSLVRTSPTTVSQIRVVEQRCAPPGSPEPDIAFATDLRVVFAASSSTATLGALSPGGFVRGVSATGLSRDRLSSPTALNLLSTPAPLDPSPDPWGGFAPAQSPSVLPVQGRLPLRRWSLRAVMEQARLNPPVSAVAISDGSGRAIRVTGLPAGSRLVAVRVEDGRGKTTQTATTLQDGVAEVRLVSTTSPTGWSLGPAAGSQSAVFADTLCALPTLAARQTSRFMHLASGRWLHLRLLVTSPADPSLLDGAEQSESFTLYSLLVPVEN